MKKTLIVIMLASVVCCGAMSFHTALADTDEKDVEIDYDSPLMIDGEESSLNRMNLLNYDVKHAETGDDGVKSYDLTKVNSIYGLDEDVIEKVQDSDDTKSITYTNLTIDENDPNYVEQSIYYVDPKGNLVNSGNDLSNDSYSDYEYTYSKTAKSVMLNTLKNNSEFKSASKIRQEVILFAMQFIGNKYVYGGNDINKGIDCSAFTRYVMKHFSKALPRTSYEQRKSGVEVDKPNTGDLVCYSGHVAIYVGDNKIIHASNKKPYPSGGIKVSSNYKYRTVRSIRSLFDD